MTKWLPPLTCPIPKTSKCHYSNDISYITRITDPRQVPASKKLIWYLHQAKNKPPEYGQADAFYRVFAKRSGDKKIKYRPKILYVLFDHRHEFVAEINTIAMAKRIMSKGFMKVKRKGHIHRVELKPGSYLLRTIDGRIPSSLYVDEAIEERISQVAITKKCQQCPNQKTTRGICHCGFWGYLRDSLRPWQFLTPHDITTRKRKKNKIRSKIIQIKL